MRKLACSIFVAFALAGCGGSSYKGLSKADFVAQADAICKRFADQRTAMVKGVDSNTNQQQAVEVLQRLVFPSYHAEVKELRKLEPPEADRATVKRMLDAVDDGITRAEHDVQRDPAIVFARGYNPVADGRAQAKAYGLKECGQH